MKDVPIWIPKGTLITCMVAVNIIPETIMLDSPEDKEKSVMTVEERQNMSSMFLTLYSDCDIGNNDKDKEQTSEGALGDSTQSPGDAHHANRDLSWKREARDATLVKQVAEAIAREMAKAQVHYQALLNERSAAAMPTSLEMIS